MTQVRISNTLAARPASYPVSANSSFPRGLSLADSANNNGRNFSILGVTPPSATQPINSAIKQQPTPVDLLAGMLNDYYNNIFVIPSVIELDNPQVGQAQPYAIWNAYLSANTYQSVVATGDTGVTNDATPTIAFKAVELKNFNVTITPSAPIDIDALYTFTFDEGEATLQLIASRATLVIDIPEIPVIQRFSYRTDILRSRNGTEQRIALRSNKPRQELEYNIVLPTNDDLRKQRSRSFMELAKPVVVPLWHEAFLITSEAAASQTTIVGNFEHLDFVQDDFVIVTTTDLSTHEIARIDTVSDSQITVQNVLQSTYPAGSLVYPAVIVQQGEGTGVRYFPVNAAVYPLKGTGTIYKALGGKGATVDTYESLPLLDRRPLNQGQNPETNFISPDSVDYGNKFLVLSQVPFSNIRRALTYSINSREELQYWKKFLDTVYGRREPFYTPTYRPDLKPLPVAAAATQIDITDDLNFIDNWFTSEGHKDLRLVLQPGDVEIFRRINVAIDNGDGTSTLTLDSAIPDLGPSTSISEINFLELSRLASDDIRFTHFEVHSTIELAIETIES